MLGGVGFGTENVGVRVGDFGWDWEKVVVMENHQRKEDVDWMVVGV